MSAQKLTPEEHTVVRAVCEVLEGEGGQLKARDLVGRLRKCGIEIERGDLNSILYRAREAFPLLMVAEGTGFWHYAQAAKAKSESDRSGPQTFTPSDEQQFVINAEASAWLLVEAGPGTGKTAVACARVAKMLNEGIPPSSILLVSFTRTAVAELRNRIRRMAQSVQGAAGVRITTLDSEAWHLGFGFRGAEHGRLSGFEENIEAATKLLKDRAPDVMEWFQSIRHIIIDEAQDLVGARAELVFELIGALSADAGVTVFVDPAQAIYGFSSDIDEDEGDPKPVVPFHEQLLAEFPESFVERKLTRLYRTSSVELRQVFEGGRSCVFGEAEPDEKLEQLETIARSSSKAAQVVDKRIDLGPHELVVFRRRSEVLIASSFLSRNGVPHRLRLSHVALGVHPWVALLFGTSDSSQMTIEVFRRRWASLGAHPFLGGLDQEEVWSLLTRTAGLPTGAIDVVSLRRILSRARPPAEFSQTEVGLTGPILGTIHASKGREADRVTLMLPRSRRKESDLEEEVRVTYVGATRARKELLVGEGYVARGLHGLGGAGGRLFSIDKGERSAQVEIGRPGDVNARSVIDKVATLSSDRAAALQDYLANYKGDPVALTARQREGVGFHYFVGTDAAKGGYLCQLDDGHVNADLFSIGNEIDPSHGLKPPPMIPHLYLVGCRTVVLPPDDPQLSRLVEPWASRGFFLAPVIKGLVKVTMFHKRGRSSF
jgi:hypothetical protein